MPGGWWKYIKRCSIMTVKVCILTTVHQPFDTRIFYKEAKSLVKSGYKVTLIVPHSKNEKVDGVNIICLPRANNRFKRIFVCTGQMFFLALGQRSDIYHFHDPELIFIGVLLKILGKKVIYDVHEDVPKQILNKSWLGNTQIRKLMSSIMNIGEKMSARLFNNILAATPEIAKRFPKNKVVLLRNFPVLELIDKTIPANYKKNKPIIVYAGGLKRVRGIKEIIQAMKYVDNKAELWLLGQWYDETLKKECENIAEWKQVKAFGFVSLKKVFQYMKIANIGISILFPIESHLKSLPVKHYEYMTCSLPIIISNFFYWKDIFGRCALFADPHDPKDIAKKILFLLENKEKSEELGKKGRALVEKRCNWEEESKKLLEMYRALL